jgi:Subtilase family
MFESAGTLAGLLAAIYLAEADFRPDIYNLSLGITCEIVNCPYCRNKTPAFAPGQLELLFALIDKRPGPRPLLVAAAGNDTTKLMIPARFPNVLPVGCSEIVMDQSQSTYRPYQDINERPFILAPGGLKDPERCIGQMMTPQWTPISPMFGTSFAAPFVTGIAARYLCAARGGACGPPESPGMLSVREFLMACLQESARRDLALSSPERYGFGVVQYNRAMALSHLANPAFM